MIENGRSFQNRSNYGMCHRSTGLRRWHVSANWDLIVILSLGQNLVDNFAVNVGQPAVDAVVAKGQPLMVDAQQVQNRGVQIVAVGAAFGGLIAKLVALAVAAFLAEYRPPRATRRTSPPL